MENSLRHGLMDEETGEIEGEVILTFKRMDEFLKITVSDNGRGISGARLEQLNDPDCAWADENRHIGIANIRKRLSVAFQGRASITIRSQDGTQVELLCPLEK